MSDAPPDISRLFTHVGVAPFFAEYWQRQTLVSVLDTADFHRIEDEIGPLDIARLAASAREGAKAWIANAYVAHSVVPVDASNAAQFFGIGATLYFTNVPLPRLTQPLADFLGAPREKVIASLFLTPAGGGAAPHFDKNENFTIQLTGTKRWRVGETPAVIAPPDGHVEGQKIPPSLTALLAGQKQPPCRTVEMQPGMLLYVPRGAMHSTDAGEPSWSLNLSYSPAMWLDLVRIGLRRRLAQSERWRGTVTGLGNGSGAILPELAAELRDLLADPGELERLARDFLDQPYD
jgi:ribosomal protein L16 Arg81 hydroxylase